MQRRGTKLRAPQGSLAGRVPQKVNPLRPPGHHLASSPPSSTEHRCPYPPSTIAGYSLVRTKGRETSPGVLRLLAGQPRERASKEGHGFGCCTTSTCVVVDGRNKSSQIVTPHNLKITRGGLTIIVFFATKSATWMWPPKPSQNRWPAFSRQP
jgi:hypothetical protein